ncbi:EF-hand domain-containing protein [Sphingomonas faeni]|uniref:EF-hand domain-containing protein n=1 Tax=Sphingomonas faeni TaxID=185950 RepID=UPI0020C11EFD|nr:EF-hand domain-containing protein [Sphingomonas faeni]MCK8457293.1 EF-hand domain-containing protein [Sphingomonas faeni]
MRRVITIGLAAALAGCATGLPRPGGPPERGRGQLFISPMGEPFRTILRPGAARNLWFAGADTDGDGRITLVEFQHDALRFFSTLDRRRDGEIDPDDIASYENVLVPEIRVVGGRHRSDGSRPGDDGTAGNTALGGPAMRFGNGGASKTAGPRERLGAARYGFFDFPEPVVAADRNGNRGIDAGEFTTTATLRFAALDRNQDGALTRGELPQAGAETWRNGSDAPAAPIGP